MANKTLRQVFRNNLIQTAERKVTEEDRRRVDALREADRQAEELRHQQAMINLQSELDRYRGKYGDIDGAVENRCAGFSSTKDLYQFQGTSPVPLPRYQISPLTPGEFTKRCAEEITAADLQR